LDVDPDGYTLSLDGAPQQPVAVTDTVVIAQLVPGVHTIGIEGVAVNCAVSGDNPATVQIIAGDTASANFLLACQPTSGALRVTTSTVGMDLDSDGYALSLDGALQQSLAASDTVVIARLEPGVHTIGIAGLSVNCVLRNGPAAVSITAGDTASAAFEVACQAASLIAFVSKRSGAPRIYVMNPDGSVVLRLTEGPGADSCPAWSPDGRRIAFSSDRDGNAEIYVMNVDGSGVTRLTFDQAPDVHPTWSPDGTRIAFERDDPPRTIYAMAADGAGVSKLTTFGRASALSPAWSPDGTKIAFTLPDSTETEPQQVALMNADGSNVRRLMIEGVQVWAEGDPAWSPNGAKLVFWSAWTLDAGRLVMADSTGENRSSLYAPFGYPGHPSWSPDAQLLVIEWAVYNQNRNLERDIYTVTLDGTVTQLTASGDSYAPSWSRLRVQGTGSQLAVRRRLTWSGGAAPPSRPVRWRTW
jgi:TolB protein